MPTRYVKLGNRTLDQWKVTELREELKKRKLSTSGLKTDLVKRLDEAVRSEMGSSMDNAEDDASESEESNEEANPGTIVSDRSENIKDGDIEIVEKLESKIGDAVDDSTDASGEGKVIEADLVEGTKATGLEQDQVPEPSIVEITEDNDTIEPVKPLSEPDSQNHGTNEDGHPQEDAKLESAHPGTQSPQISESSTPVVPDNAQDLHGSRTQNEAIHSTEPRENDGLKEHQPDQPVTHQVSDVDPNLGFQVTSDSVCTESVSIFEKNELKIDVIDDNVKLELDVKPEMQQSPSGAVPDAGESHPMDVGEPLEKIVIKDDIDEKHSEEPHDENLQVENTHDSVVEKVDCFKSTDSGDLGPPEKLSLDRSSGDDSMEEDVMESKLMDDKSDSFTENVEKSGTHSEKEEDHVDVVGHDKPVEMVQHAEVNITNVESDTVSTLTSGKRKFLDKEADGSNDVVKKVRSWNSEGVKSSQPQSGSLTPKGLSEPTSKPIPGTNSMAGIEAPKESVVPPSPRAPTNSLRIDRFLRPFTLKAAQQLLGKTGTVTGFWMDHIKTHCYVSYSSVDEAEKTRNAVYNLQWPPNGGRLLVAEFVDPQEVKSRVEAPLASPATPSTTPTPTQTPSAAQPSPRQQVLKQQIPPTLPPPPLSNPPHVRERLHPPREQQQPLPSRDRLNLPLPPPPPLPEKNEPPILTLDDLFRKTKATPRIYYLPLSDELVAAKLKTQGKTVTQ